MELQVIMGVVGILTLLSNAINGLVLFIVRGIKRNQERQWAAIDEHRLNRELHPDVEGRVERLERLANGRTT